MDLLNRMRKATDDKIREQARKEAERRIAGATPPGYLRFGQSVVV
jgi:hypothetical protein